MTSLFLSPFFSCFCSLSASPVDSSNQRSFTEIPEANVCEDETHCEIIDPIEFAKQSNTPEEIEGSFFQKAKELLGMSSV